MASTTLPRSSKKRKSPWVRLLKQALVLFATILLIGASVLGFFYFNAKKDAEDKMNDLQARIDSVNKPTTKILSRDGVVLYSVSTENRIPLKLDQIPKFVQNAVLAAEDHRFYQHTGVDMTSMMRVLMVDLKGRKLAQGGSTITMQLVKLLFNGSSKTLGRKMNDIAYAQVMEQRLPKERILELYLNKVYFGEGAFGIGEAARTYFDKSIEKLTIGEAAMLARCIRRPSYENPIRDIDAALANRDVVLGIMRTDGTISDDQYDKAVAEKPKISAKSRNGGEFYKPGTEYFVNHVKSFLDKDLGLDLINGGYTIETSLDYGLQKLTMHSVREVVDDNPKVNQGAFMSMDSDGYILSEVGGLNYKDHQQNLITQGGLQPGSGFKPIVYATALKAGVITMDSMISNAPIHEVDPVTGRKWDPGNSSRKENHSSYGLRTALAMSVNLCAIHTIQEVSPSLVVQTAYDNFGFRSKLAPYAPLALGSSAVTPIEMAEAYSVFMLHGDRVRPQPVMRVTDSDGKIVKQYEAQKFVGAFDPVVSDEVDELLRGVVEYGTGTAANVVPNARGKTGTSNEGKDLWFTGYADGVLGVGWTGRERKIKGVWAPQKTGDEEFGGTVTAKIWAKVMKVACERYGKVQAGKPIDAPKPKDISQEPSADVDPDLAAPAGDTKAGSTVDEAGNPIPEGAEIKPGETVPPIKPEAGDGKVKPGVDKGQGPTAPPTAKPPKTKRPAKREDEPLPDTIIVDICQDSGLIANPYCNETVTRTFRRGKEPKRKCQIHGPGG